MRFLDILEARNVSIAGPAEGEVRSKAEALRRLAELFAGAHPQASAEELLRVLTEREKLQSTGVGGGVAIPHGAVEGLDRLLGAVLIVPRGIPFDAIDGAPVTMLFSVVGPKRAAGEHLKALARISRLLRDDRFRADLLAAKTGAEAYGIIANEERRATS